MTGTVNCSILCTSVDRASGSAQFARSVIIPRHDLFVIPLALNYTQSWNYSFLLGCFVMENCLMMSSERRLAISSEEFAVWVGLRPEILLETVLLSFIDTDIDDPFLVVVLSPTRSRKVLLYVVTVRLRIRFKFSATENV